MTVTKDVASGKYVPLTSAEVTSFLSGTGVAFPVEGWQMQDSAAPITDFIASDPMTEFGGPGTELFQQAVTGYTRKAIVSTPEGGGHAIGTTNNITTSGTAMVLRKLNSLPSANRVIGYFLGAAICADSSGHVGVSDGITSTFNFGSALMGTTVRPMFFRVNSVGPTSKVTTDQESVSGPSFTFDSSNKLFFGNPGFGIGGAAESFLFGLRWSSLLSDADVAAVIGRLTTGAVASIAVTPSSPSILVTATQQMTAIATFQDGSTLDITSNPLTVWASATPLVATVTSTGLITGMSVGTSSVTAAFGGVTSGADIVSIIGSTTPNKYSRMLMALLPPGKIRRLIGDSVLSTLLAANADELGRLEDRTGDLLDEADPTTTVEMLPEWEAELALPSTGTNAQRQARIVARLVARQRYRPVDFQTALAPLLVQLAANVVVIERSAAFASSIGDAREIFRFFIYRDPTLPGTADLVSAQALVNQIKPSHTVGTVIESINFLCDDAHSLCDRDLLGA